MSEWVTQIQNYIQQYVNHSPVLYMYIAGLIFLCFRGKDKRRMIVYPSLLLVIVILNPVLYGYVWIKLIEYAFWRMLWMIPVLPVIGCAVVELAGIAKKDWVMYVVTVIFIGIVFFKCDNIYRQDGVFVKAENSYKLPQASVDIAHFIMENNDSLTALAPSGLYCYLRQYDGDINLVFGRDADTYILPITDEETLELVRLVKENGGDAARLAELAVKKDVDIIILPVDNSFESLDSYGYAILNTMHGYYIYQRMR